VKENSIAALGASSSSELLGTLLSSLAESEKIADARAVAIRSAVEAVDADFGALVYSGTCVGGVGLDEDAPWAAILAAAGQGAVVDVPGMGPCRSISVRFVSGSLVLGRRGIDGFTDDEIEYFRAHGRLLDLVMSLERRRSLLTQLTALQDVIARRAPLQEVFETIVRATSLLLDVEMVAVRITDFDDPSRMRTPAAIGHPPELLAALHDGPVLAGATAAAPEHGELVVIDDYLNAPRARPEAVAYGVTTAMAAPLYEHDTVIGSLVVCTRRKRRYTPSDQGLLAAFAQHASLALAAARTGETMRQALTDPLTGLANRAVFMDRLELALARAARKAAAVSVIFVDLDRFKLVNDTLGHSAGDTMLVGVAGRLAGCLRRGETAARLGGDEFAVLIDESRDQMAGAHVAERIRDSLREPIMIGDREVFATASIGIALGTTEEPETLLRNADVAMYRAKGRGKDRYEVFEPEMHAEVVDRLELEAELRHAVARDELELHFQPAFKLESGAPLGVEALVRWRHPKRGLLPPGVFIPLAEESGLILPVGRWVLNEACRAAAAWQETNPGVQVAVNLSAWQLEQPDIVDEVAALLELHELPRRTLVLELTETILMHDTEATMARLQALKELDIRIAIDDFGTGYSSLQYLQRFPIDVLKVPKPFVDELNDEHNPGVLISVILDLCRRLDLGTVAEGIETERQAERLRQLGCRWGQGYLYAKPMPEAQLIEFLGTPAVSSL
jgi:diguanylate cyclase (GGDEF)-like protein